jgi:glycerol-3-phosphate dehydrogenase
MAGTDRVQFHLERERQCREMAEKATERAIKHLHNQLADHHAAMAALELSRNQSAFLWSAVRSDSASERPARSAMPQNRLARLH